MRLMSIYEGMPDHRAAIVYLLSKLSALGYKLVEHIWEESTGSFYLGYLLARQPELLENYKLRDFDSPDAYHIARSYIERQDLDINDELYAIKPEFLSVYKILKERYPDLDEILQQDGDIVVPNDAEVIQLLTKYNISYEQTDDYIYPDIVDEMPQESMTREISSDDLIDQLDEQDLLIVAKRLYDILDGEAPRWLEYRLDTKSDQPLVDFDSMLDSPQEDDPADWWKNE